jgi:hypothetical protein
VQKLGSVAKMATMLGECTMQEQCSVVGFLWTKGLNAKDIHKEMFPVYGGKCLSRKAVHKLGDRCFADDEEVETEVRKWLRQQSKGFCTAGFDMLVGTGVSMLVEDMSRNKCFFQVRISHVLCFISIA